MAERDPLSKEEYKKIMSRPENKGEEAWKDNIFGGEE
jgi:hypothetical protein